MSDLHARRIDYREPIDGIKVALFVPNQPGLPEHIAEKLDGVNPSEEIIERNYENKVEFRYQRDGMLPSRGEQEIANRYGNGVVRRVKFDSYDDLLKFAAPDLAAERGKKGGPQHSL